MLIKMGLLILMSPFPNSCDLIGPAFQQLAQVSRDGVELSDKMPATMSLDQSF